jgi:thioredoxin reductase (NADPH)
LNLLLQYLIYLIIGLLTIGIPAVYWWSYRSRSHKAAEIHRQSIEAGLNEPPSLHPLIDNLRCIGSGACVQSCPEGAILGLVKNKAVLIQATRCIGHGECAAACPTMAIKLVFGSAERGVDIPEVNADFETSASGIYIAGELGGMGLIRNAVTQGQQAASAIAKSLKSEKRSARQSKESADDVLHDLLIIGAGPAGIAAGLQAHLDGLKILILDQSQFGGTILHYPRRKLVMTQPMEFPGFAKERRREFLKEELLEKLASYIKDSQLPILEQHCVESISGKSDDFKVSAKSIESGQRILSARRVLLSIGRRGSPRQLDIPGEDQTHVYYSLLEPEIFTGDRCVVIGGGDSAIECALQLAEIDGPPVRLVYRGDSFYRARAENRQKLTASIEQQKIITHTQSKALAITQTDLEIESTKGIENFAADAVFILIGGVLPTALLESAGVRVTRKYGDI